MVHYRAGQEHFSRSMRVMNDLRKNGTFCDISLIVGSQVVRAHRCVLSVGSSYFNALFLGQFAEASKNEINLSEVTKDISDLEMMVDCLYTGEIDINADNLDTVAKLSSYFIIETALEFCNKFIGDTFSLQTCLKIHQCAVEHGLTQVMSETTPMVKTRFPDFIIFEDDTLNISPKELVYLHQIDVFQFCTPGDVLKFVVGWVKRGLTEQHISIGTEILDSVGCVKDDASLPMMHSTEETLNTACEEMLSALSETRLAGHEEFINLVSKLRNQCIGNGDSKRRYDLRVLPMAKIPSTNRDTDKENVLITLSPRPCVINTFLYDQKHPRPYKDPVFDVCAYVPSLGCWYYIKPIDDQDLYTRDLGRLLNDSQDDWVFAMRADQLVFAYMKDTLNSPEGLDVNNMALHSLNGNEYKEFVFGDQVKQHLQDNEWWNRNRFCVVTGPDNTMYMITVINFQKVVNGINNEFLFFRGFKFQDSDQSWQLLFQSEKYQLIFQDFMGGEIHELHASISTVSNEMLVTYSDNRGDFRTIAIVVNLDLEAPVPVSVLDSEILEFDDFDPVDRRHVSIVQGKKHFFILLDILQRMDGKRFIKVKYQVKYHSSRLTIVKTDKIELGETEVIVPEAGHSEIRYSSMPCLLGWNISDRESTWYICGDKEMVSTLTEVTVSGNRTPVIKAHPPPPFTCITAAFAGTVSKDVLKMFKPVSFLGKQHFKDCRDLSPNS